MIEERIDELIKVCKGRRKKMNKNLCNTCIATEFMCDQDLIAMNLVKKFTIDHMDKSDKDYQKNVDELQIFTCWKNKTLQNWKYLISTNLPDGMYYEVTFNGDKREWYFDAYKKFANESISEEVAFDLLSTEMEWYYNGRNQ